MYQMIQMQPISAIVCKKQLRRCLENTTFMHIHHVCVRKKHFYLYVKQQHLISYVHIILSVFLGCFAHTVPLWFIAVQLLMHFYLLKKFKSVTLFA